MKTYVCAWRKCGREFSRYARPSRPDLPERCCSKRCMAKLAAERAGRTIWDDEATPGVRTHERWRAQNYRRRTARRRYNITAAYEKRIREAATSCPLCSVVFVEVPYAPASKELDHILPICVGGTHTVGNVRIICRLCNQRRPHDGNDYQGWLRLCPGWAPEEVPSSRRYRRKPCACGLERDERDAVGHLLPRCSACQAAWRARSAERDRRNVSWMAGRRPLLECEFCGVWVLYPRDNQHTCGSAACQGASRLRSCNAWLVRKRIELGPDYRKTMKDRVRQHA